MTKSGLLEPSPDVVFTSLKSGEAVLLHIGKRKYYTLNVTAARIWQLLSEGKQAEDIAVHLTNEFAVGHDRAAASVARLLTELAEGGFLDENSR